MSKEYKSEIIIRRKSKDEIYWDNIEKENKRLKKAFYKWGYSKPHLIKGLKGRKIKRLGNKRNRKKQFKSKAFLTQKMLLEFFIRPDKYYSHIFVPEDFCK